MPNTLPFGQIQNQFASHIRDPENTAMPAGIPSERMAIYRDLFFNNLDGTLSSAFPVTQSLFSEDEWKMVIRDFMVKHRCKTPLFYEVAREFLDYIKHEREAKNDPDFLYELAHYEWVELALMVAEDEFQQEQLNEDSLTLRYTRSPLAWVLSYDYPVHLISSDFQPELPSDQPSFYLVYRNSEDEVKFVELNPVSARLLDLLAQDLLAHDAAMQIAEELQHPEPEQVLQAARELITDWRQKGVLFTNS